MPWLVPSNFDRSFEHMINMQMGFGDPSHPHETEPSYSIQSNDKAAYVEIELPGVAKEDMSVEAKGDHLVITGNRYESNFSMMEDGQEAPDVVEVQNEGAEMREVEADEGRTDEAIEDKKKLDVDQKKQTAKLAVVYKKEFTLDRRADVTSIKADNRGDGILRLLIPNKLESDVNVIQISV